MNTVFENRIREMKKVNDYSHFLYIDKLIFQGKL